MSNPLNLPESEYYYDEEREKYFLIEPDHEAAMSGDMRYARSTIEAERAERKRRIAEEETKARDVLERVQRSKLTTLNSIPGSVILRELNSSSSNRNELMQQVKAYAGTVQVVEAKTFPPHYDRDNQPKIGPATCMAYDAEHEILFTARSYNGSDGCFIFTQHPDTFPSNKVIESSRKNACGAIIAARLGAGSIDALHYSPTGYLLALCGEDRFTPQVTICSVQPDPDCDGMAEVMVYDSLTVDSSSLWFGAPNPYINTASDGPIFAAGAGHSVFSLSVLPETYSFANFPSDVLSVAFTSRNTIASGGRDGKVRLWDTRGHESQYFSDCLRPRKKGAIQHMRVIGDNYIALQGHPTVAGLYDFRKAGFHAKPVVEYPGPERKKEAGTFDVDEKLGLVVRGSLSGTTRLYSLWTGEVLREFSAGTGDSRILKFVETKDETMILGFHGRTEFKLALPPGEVD